MSTIENPTINDCVNSQSHYQSSIGGVECITAIKSSTVADSSELKWIATGLQFKGPDIHKHRPTDHEWFNSLWDSTNSIIDGYIPWLDQEETK